MTEPRNLDRLRAEQRGLGAAWARVQALWSPIAIVRDLIEELIPTWLRPDLLRAWLAAFDATAARVEQLGAAVDYLIRADDLVAHGLATYQQHDDGAEIDLVVSAEGQRELGPLPAVLAASQAARQGAPAPLGVPVPAIVLVVAIVGATASVWAIADALESYLYNDSLRIRSGMLTMLGNAREKGWISQDTTDRMLSTLQSWAESDAAIAHSKGGVSGAASAAADAAKWIAVAAVAGGALWLASTLFGPQTAADHRKGGA